VSFFKEEVYDNLLGRMRSIGSKPYSLIASQMCAEMAELLIKQIDFKS